MALEHVVVSYHSPGCRVCRHLWLHAEHKVYTKSCTPDQHVYSCMHDEMWLKIVPFYHGHVTKVTSDDPSMGDGFAYWFWAI